MSLSECSCLGKNEKCGYCGGTGIVGQQIFREEIERGNRWRVEKHQKMPEISPVYKWKKYKHKHKKFILLHRMGDKKLETEIKIYNDSFFGYGIRLNVYISKINTCKQKLLSHLYLDIAPASGVLRSIKLDNELYESLIRGESFLTYDIELLGIAKKMNKYVNLNIKIENKCELIVSYFGDNYPKKQFAFEKDKYEVFSDQYNAEKSLIGGKISRDIVCQGNFVEKGSIMRVLDCFRVKSSNKKVEGIWFGVCHNSSYGWVHQSSCSIAI